VFHTLAPALSDEIYRALRDRTPADPERMRLVRRPAAAWEHERAATADEHRPNRTERRAAARDRRD
jgi:hypothetical protein